MDRTYEGPPDLQHENYTIGWICAIPVEAQAARMMLDEQHIGVFPLPPGEENVYEAGRIGRHNVVIACLPEHKTGNFSAAGLITQMRRSFTKLRYAFMVGIGAGIPGLGLNPDIRLSDIVVAWPTDKSSGIVGYELGKETIDGFQRRNDTSWQLDPVLQNIISKIKGQHGPSMPTDFLKHLDAFSQSSKKRKLGQVAPSQDQNIFAHPLRRGCKDVLYDEEALIEIHRPARPDPEAPTIHYGIIASGDKVIKSGKHRDELR
jgi:nucleoside phosphorylase